MRKYFFEKKLEEGVLIKRPGRMLPSVIINGMESETDCPLRGKCLEHIEHGIPCLVGRNGIEGFYQVYGISLCHPEDAEKKWICISAGLIERAVGFFLENHQMQELNAEYDHVVRNAGLRLARVDFLAGSLMIEIKCSFAGLNAACRSWKKGWGMMPTAWQMLGFINLLNSPNYAEKRAVSLLIQQKGLDGGQLCPVPSGIMYETVKTVLCMGLEFWAADLEFDAEGIRLVSCRDVSELILSGKPGKN